MKKPLRLILISLIVLGSLYAAYRYWQQKNYPYGVTHRCSKSFAIFIEEYADHHGGQYPQPGREGQHGLDMLFDDYTDDPFVFKMIVGKAGDLDQARAFYARHGYLRNDHSSWHYVSGLTNVDEGRALA